MDTGTAMNSFQGAPPLPNEAQRLEALRRYRILDSLPESSFDDLARLAAEICEVPIAQINLIDEERQWSKASVGLPRSELPRAQSFCAYSIHQAGQITEVPDTHQDARFASHALVRGAPHIRFYAGAPLLSPEGLALGSLCVIDIVPRHLGERQRWYLETLRRSVVTQLELRRLSLDASVQRSILYDLLHQLAGERDPDTIMQQAVQSIVRIGRWQSVGISLLSADGQHWQTRAEDRMEPGEVGQLHPIARGVIGRAYRTGQVQIVPDVRNDPDFFIGEGVKRVGSELVIPISVQGRVLGAINLESEQHEDFDESDVAFARSLAEILSIALRNAEQFSSLQREIAERSQAELALTRTQDELLELTRTLEQRVQERSAEVQDLYENAPTGYHSLDAAGRFLRVNQTELAWLGYRREELLGRPFTDLLTPEGLARFQEHFSLFKERGWVRDLEFEMIRSDGSLLPVLLSATAIYASDGSFLMTRSTMTDNSLRKQAEEAQRLANAELERALRMKDEFLANMSHELRTPLNAVLALSESLLEEIRGPLNERQRDSLRTIEGSGRHLLTLINDILDLSKVEAGRLNLQLEAVPVSDICRASLQLIREQALRKRLRLEFLPGEGVAEVTADPTRLKQMLVNLLSNAVKFTPAGGTVALRVMADHGLPAVVFEVADNGIGIAQADLARLFQPFTQLDSGLSRHHEGTGLGLVLVRRLAELHGGQVSVASAPGQGSTFRILLPARPAPPDPGPGPAPVPQAGWAPRSALVIEDSQSTAEQLARYLREAGVTTVAHAESPDALGLALSLRPDIIFLDLLMPEGSGWDILSQLRADPLLATIPVVIISVLDARERGAAAGASAYLLKPIAREQLRQTLRALARPQALRASPASARLLLAEDNLVNLEVLRDYLHEKGFEVLVARTGHEALAQAEAGRPDLILMDIQMPGLSGLEAIRRLRASPAHASTPIVALTARAMPGDREQCLAAGANEYLTKPVGLRALVELIRRMLG